MFSDFKDAFLNQDETYNDLPKEVIDSLNEKLPEGFEYVSVGDGACRLVPKDKGEIKIELQIPSNLIEKHNITSWDQLSDYSYRTQTPIVVSESDKHLIEINGATFKFEDIIQFPFDNFRDSKVSLIPTPFQPFEITIEDEHDKELKDLIKVQRQPYDDMNKRLFKNIDNNILEITYILDEIKQSINFNVKVNIDKSKDVKDIVRGLKLYRSCLEGNMKFAGYALPTIETKEKGIEETIKFWSKVLEIEGLWGIKFNVNSNVTIGNAKDIEKLYKSLVEGKFYKEYVNVGNIVTEKVGVLDKKYKDTIIEAPGLMLEFIESSEFKLWETTITTYDCVRLYDLKVQDIVLKNKENEEYEFILEHNPQEKTCRTVRHFLKEEEAYGYKTNNSDLDNAELITIR